MKLHNPQGIISLRYPPHPPPPPPTPNFSDKKKHISISVLAMF